MGTYSDFLSSKRLVVAAGGVEVLDDAIHSSLFPFQRALTRWACAMGRGGLFADTGLGKTRCQIEWARLIGVRTLIIAPLSVVRQTVAEAAKIGVTVAPIREESGAPAVGISATNYEMAVKMDLGRFGAVVLDESSILKGIDGATRRHLTEACRDIPYRLCCTATPAPNDVAELANHAEFLGLMSRMEMLAAFFVHDSSDSVNTGGWRLKGHAATAFYRWIASWGMSLRRPSDLGYNDDGFVLPPLRIEPIWVDAPVHTEGALFRVGLDGVTDRLRVRQATITMRVKTTADLMHDSVQWVAWCGLNEEGRLLKRILGGDAVLVEGHQSPEEKAAAFEAFQDGRVRVLITKGRIGGFGMNFQNAHQMAFVGLNDSFETFYQCVRRCWRYGQTHPVTVHPVIAEVERPIWENVQRKEREAEEMRDGLIAAVRDIEREKLGLQGNVSVEYAEGSTSSPNGKWTMLLGDAVEHLKRMLDESVDLSVFSPPFLSLFTYTPTERDLGNCRGSEEFFQHFGFVVRGLLRVTRPGRLAAVHVSQVPARLAYDGYMGIKDFRGDVIRAFERDGWIYHGEVCIDKDPQVQAVRSHAKQLLFVQLYKDSSWSVPAYADYILVFRKMGDNAVPVVPDLTRNQWIEWARPVWTGIDQTNTLNARTAREQDDERHLAPLQLGVIERCIRLWTNPGELVLSPFAGIGSEGYMAVKLGRRFLGVELKKSYFDAAVENLTEAEIAGQLPLFQEVNR